MLPWRHELCQRAGFPLGLMTLGGHSENRSATPMAVEVYVDPRRVGGKPCEALKDDLFIGKTIPRRRIHSCAPQSVGSLECEYCAGNSSIVSLPAYGFRLALCCEQRPFGMDQLRFTDRRLGASGRTKQEQGTKSDPKGPGAQGQPPSCHSAMIPMPQSAGSERCRSRGDILVS